MTGINPDIELAKEFERIAAEIETNPEWFADETIDDNTIARGLLEAAKARRAKARNPSRSGGDRRKKERTL